MVQYFEFMDTIGYMDGYALLGAIKLFLIKLINANTNLVSWVYLIYNVK